MQSGNRTVVQMKVDFEVEVRESDKLGYEPTLRGVMLTEGRAASGGRAELFAPGSVSWPHDGVNILLEHRGKVEARGQVVRERDGRLTISSRATGAIRAAVASGKRFMSVEFRSIEERTTKGGVRELLRAVVDAAALVSHPEFDSTLAEVRKSAPRRRLWL